MTDEAGLVERLLKLPDPKCTYADHSYPAYSVRQMREYAEAALAEAKVRITALEGERDEQARLADERSERMGELYRRSDRAVSRALAAEAALSRQAGQVAGPEWDMHGGYGQCSGTGSVWVDDGSRSNFYSQGSCPRCRPASAPEPVAEQRVTLDREVVETLFRDALHMGAVLVDEPFSQRVESYSTETRLFTDRLLALLSPVNTPASATKVSSGLNNTDGERHG